MFVSGGGMNCVSCDICVYHLGLFVFFPQGIPQLQSDWSLSCDHGLDYSSKCENNNRTTCYQRPETHVKKSFQHVTCEFDGSIRTHFLSLLFFPFLFRFFASLYLLSFPLSSFFFFFFFPIDLRLSCVCVVIGTTCNMHVSVFLGWQAG